MSSMEGTDTKSAKHMLQTTLTDDGRDIFNQRLQQQREPRLWASIIISREQTHEGSFEGVR